MALLVVSTARRRTIGDTGREISQATLLMFLYTIYWDIHLPTHVAEAMLNASTIGMKTLACNAYSKTFQNAMTDESRNQTPLKTLQQNRLALFVFKNGPQICDSSIILLIILQL